MKTKDLRENDRSKCSNNENKPQDTVVKPQEAHNIVYKIIEIDAQTLETKDLAETNDVSKAYNGFKLLKPKSLTLLVLEINGILTSYKACKSIPTKDLAEFVKVLTNENHKTMSENNTRGVSK